MFVEADHGQAVLLGQGGDPTVVGRDRFSVGLQLAADFSVERQSAAIGQECLRVFEKRIEPRLKRDPMTRLSDAVKVFAQTEEGDTQARGRLQNGDQIFITARQSAECVGVVGGDADATKCSGAVPGAETIRDGWPQPSATFLLPRAAAR